MTSTDRSTRRDSRWRSAPVLVIAVLALIMSTAGGAYAVAKNSIGTKQLKNNAVTSSKIKNSSIRSSDVKNGSLTSADLAPGTIPVVPPPAKPGPKLSFAKVSTTGNLLSGSPGVTSSGTGGASGYTVDFGTSITACAITSTATSSSDNTSATTTSATSIGVFARDVTAGGAPYTTTAFSVVVVC